MKITKSLMALMVSSVSLFGLDYSVYGGMTSSTRLGLGNNLYMNTDKGIYPNNSFWSLSAYLGGTLTLLADENNFLEMGLSGMVGGVAYDSTRNIALFPTNSFSSGSQLGLFTQVYMPAWGDITGAYLDYQNAFYGVRLGRYLFKNTDWLSGRNQGLEVYAGPENYRVYGIYVNARSSSNGEWLNHFVPRNDSVNKFGLFMFGADATANITDNQRIFFRPYVHYQPGVFFAPGAKLSYDYKYNDYINFKTTILSLFVSHNERVYNHLSAQDWGHGRFLDANRNYVGRVSGTGGTTLFLREDVTFDNYGFALALYKNFGNPNDLIGSYGDPTGLNTWVYTIYSTAGAGWSDFFSPEAVNVYGIFNHKVNEVFSYDIIARITRADRSNEHSLAFICSYKFNDSISMDLRLELAGTTTVKGYKISNTLLKNDVYTDKSMAFWYLKAKI